MKIGLIREEKMPSDSRVVLTPKQAAEAKKTYPGLEIVVQPADTRCYKDEEYSGAGIKIQEDLTDCDILIGVKEVPVDALLEGKTYFFFSHTIKKQPYNQKLLQEILKRNIRMIDYECLTDERGIRVIAFGRWAGIVGAHNGLYTWSKKTGAFQIKRAVECHDYADLIRQYRGLVIPPIKIATTGSGRVAGGANELLGKAGIRQVEADEFVSESFSEPVFTNLKCEHLYVRRNDGGFDLQEFFDHPDRYSSSFEPYMKTIDLFINSIYWDPSAPAYFSLDDMVRGDFNIGAIADITCDIAPAASIPSTIRASTIKDPIYGFDPKNQAETNPHGPDVIDVMAVDNLPNELPRDASQSFGEQFLAAVMPELIKTGDSAFLNRATIAANGDLTPPFEYLRDYTEGR